MQTTEQCSSTGSQPAWCEDSERRMQRRTMRRRRWFGYFPPRSKASDIPSCAASTAVKPSAHAAHSRVGFVLDELWNNIRLKSAEKLLFFLELGLWKGWNGGPVVSPRQAIKLKWKKQISSNNKWLLKSAKHTKRKQKNKRYYQGVKILISADVKGSSRRLMIK